MVAVEIEKRQRLEMCFGHRTNQKWVMCWMWETSQDKEELNLDQGGSRGREEKRVDSGDILKVDVPCSADGWMWDLKEQSQE